MKKLRMMRQNNVLCDLEVFSDDGTKYRVHSCVWVAAFEDSRTLQSNKYKGCGNETSKIELLNISGDVLSTIVDFIYGEEINIIPVGLDDALKRLGFHGLKYYLDNGLSNLSCNYASSLTVTQQSDEADIEILKRPLHPNNTHPNSDPSMYEVKIKSERIEEDNPSVSLDTGNYVKEELSEIHTTPVNVKLEPVEMSDSMSYNTDDENDDVMNNIKIYSKQDGDNQTVTVCVEYDCSEKDENEVVQTDETQTVQPSHAPEDKTPEKDNYEKDKSTIQLLQQDNAVGVNLNPLMLTKPPSSVSSTSESINLSKKPRILPKFSSSQGDIVTVATFLSFAELQKKGKSWKLQESLVPIPMSGNSAEAFNKLPIFPQSSQPKALGDKRGRGRPKSCESERIKAPKIKKTSMQTGSSAATVTKKNRKTTAVSALSSTTIAKTNVPQVEPVLKGVPKVNTTCTSVQGPVILPSNYTMNHNILTDTSQAVTCTTQSKLALPANLPASSTSVTTSQQQGYRGLPTMVPCVDFNNSIDIGCIGSVAPKTNSNIFVQPRPITSECIIPKGNQTNQGSEEAIQGRTFYSKCIPTSSQYVIHPGQFVPLSSIATPATSVSQSSGLKSVASSKPDKHLVTQSIQKTSSVGAESCFPHYREIKPKFKNPEIKATNADKPVIVEQPLRKPRKRTRSLQNNKTLLNEPLDKYISDNLKKSRKNTPSSLKIKMNSLQPIRFLKRKKPLDMVAELYKNSGGASTKSTSNESVKSREGQENTPKCDAY